MARLLIVSNRLPITVRRGPDGLEVEASAGGLATGLRGPHERSGGVWIGWTGLTEELPAAEARVLAEQLSELRIVEVPLGADEAGRYYEGICNGIFWPLFHYLVDQLPLDLGGFEVYERVNERFADAVAAAARPGDLIWIHDYQLMLLPRLVRERVPGARIGFFLHIPFPSSELFRTLPCREAIVQGLLGADLIGFHTAAYMRHFASSCLRVVGASTEVDHIQWEGRPVRVGVYPMGVDAADFARVAEHPDVRRQAASFRGEEGVRVLVGIDRLDYTKGIPRRLLAFERLLLRHPELTERVRLIQVAVPSRTNVGAYQEFRDQLDALIGRSHGAFATPSWAPIHYLYRGLSQEDVVALYRAADVMLVTPIRDGMNLVAKEFVAARTDEDGVLVLSEFAGAASELAEALRVNPYDVEETAQAYHRALTMAPEERRTRMRGLRRRVATHDVHRWAQGFLDQLERIPSTADPAARVPSPGAALEAARRRLTAAEFLVLLLDYDGTLVPFAETPELARPDPWVPDVLGRLAAGARTEVHVVSGRPWQSLEAWLGAGPVWLHAEHGAWSRPRDGAWARVPLPSLEWRDPVRRILAEFTARTPGSLVEEKTAGLAWHYRMAEPEFGASQANELKLHLSAVLSNEPVEILDGAKVVEIRPHGLHKGRVVPPILERVPPDSLLAALGDDRTDEDLFAALPADAVTIHVGDGPSAAGLRLASVRAARAFLETLAAAR